MIESTIVNEWKAEARREGERKGELKGAAAGVLRCLRTRFGPVPTDVAQSLNACADMARLATFFDAALKEVSFDDFRRVAGI